MTAPPHSPSAVQPPEGQRRTTRSRDAPRGHSHPRSGRQPGQASRCQAGRRPWSRFSSKARRSEASVRTQGPRSPPRPRLNGRDSSPGCYGSRLSWALAASVLGPRADPGWSCFGAARRGGLLVRSLREVVLEQGEGRGVRVEHFQLGVVVGRAARSWIGDGLAAQAAAEFPDRPASGGTVVVGGRGGVPRVGSRRSRSGARWVPGVRGGRWRKRRLRGVGGRRPVAAGRRRWPRPGRAWPARTPDPGSAAACPPRGWSGRCWRRRTRPAGARKPVRGGWDRRGR
jgi:hypothetical protein